MTVIIYYAINWLQHIVCYYLTWLLCCVTYYHGIILHDIITHGLYYHAINYNSVILHFIFDIAKYSIIIPTVALLIPQGVLL
jgi:hypothetical protein